MSRERVISGLLLVGGLAFAFLGQFYFVYGWRYGRGLFSWGVAVLLFGVLLYRAAGRSGQPEWRPPMQARRRPLIVSARVLAAAVGVWLALWAGWLARQQPETADFIGLLWLWLIGVTCFLLAFVPPFSARALKSHLLCWLRSHRVELLGLTALLLAALAVRAINLEHIPPNLGGDEGEQALEALALLGPPLGNPFATSWWFSVPNLSFLPLGLSMRVFGESVAGLRAVSALTGTATVLTTFLLARELWGRRVAWLAAGALACSHFHIHFSRLGSHQIGDGLLVTLALYLLGRGMRSRRAIHFALAGAVIGLGWYGYFGARLIGVVVAVYVGWRAIVEYRFLARYGRLLLVLLVAALLVVGPLFVYYADHPDKLASRAQQVSVFASEGLARERQRTGLSTATLLLLRFWKTFSAFAFYYPLDPVFYYNPTVPLLDFISGALFVLGLVWATVHHHRSANGLVLLWFWLALILGWVLTDRPPCSQRMVIVAPALALLASLGFEGVMRLGKHVVGDWRRFWSGAVAMLLVAVAVLNLRFYFVVYTPKRIYGNPTAEIATVLARYLKEKDDSYFVYFHASPVMYWRFGTLRFMARGVDGMDVPPLNPGQAPAAYSGRGARFVLLPHRLSELPAVRAQYPGGDERSIYSTADERLLYVLYEVSP